VKNTQSTREEVEAAFKYWIDKHSLPIKIRPPDEEATEFLDGVICGSVRIRRSGPDDYIIWKNKS
jgi:hypothetical protein